MTIARRAGFWLLVTVILLWSLGPFLWQAVTSLQPDRNLLRTTPQWFPSPATVQHYVNLFVGEDFLAYIRNSVIITGSATLVGLVFGACCAYALARLPFFGKSVVMAVLLGISMFPQIAIVAPLYQLATNLNLLDTFRGLAGVYTGLSLPLMVFVMYGHFRSIPREIDEAAEIDGAGPLRSLYSVLVPMALPGVVTAGLLGFILNWNEFMIALSFTSSPDRQPIPVGIANFTGLYFVPWGDMAAASIVVTVPLIVLVLIFQRRIMSGLTAGAVKQ